jgi:large subunit ribosomal protein L17
MRHRKAGRKFKRSPEHRRMLLRNLATLSVRGIKRQKALGGDAADRMPLAEFRRSLAVLTRKDIAYKLFQEIGPRFLERPGGYTRIYKLAHRRQGDCSPMALIELIPADEPVRSQSVQPEVVGSEA